MKKNTLTIINDIVNVAKQKGIAQLTTEDQTFNGRNITINNKNLINFGSCSYLGLEIDNRLKEGAIEAIQRYGVQFSSSRSYLRCTLYEEYEQLVSKIFDDAPIVLSTSVSLGHHGVIPIIVSEKDAIIMDQQVHSSVQDAAMKMRAQGTTVTIIRHNDLEELQNKINELSVTHEKIWYMIDGVYSMYGDFAPMIEIAQLLKSNKKLFLYADDAHGMGWCGVSGKGYVLNAISNHEKIVVATSLNKAFAAGGGAFIFPNKDLRDQVRNCGGPFMFSGPHQIAVLGAGIASAKILLSDELPRMQELLKQNINYCHTLLESKGLPVVSNPNTPIFFIGLGLVRVGNNLVKKMLNEGFYVNISAFPAVPETCTGIRFTITCHHTFEDIENMVEALAYHFPRVLEEEGRTINDIFRAFRRIKDFKDTLLQHNPAHSKENLYTVQYEKSITDIPQKLWNRLIAKNSFDWKGFSLLEEVFTNNPDAENNWTFHYYIVRDQNNYPVAATMFTSVISKDDMLAPAEVSKKIEEIREKDKYHMTSNMLLMGTMLSEGQHLFIDRERSDWKKGLMTLLDTVWKEQDMINAGSIHLRDFDPADIELCDFFKEQGFIMTPMPETHIIENIPWTTSEDFIQQLPSDKRYYVKKKAIAYEHFYDVKIVHFPSEKQIDLYYELYKNVAEKSYEISGFTLPKKLFTDLALSKEWEFIELSIKPEYDNHSEQSPVGMAINCMSNENYTFLLTGMNYEFLESYNLYAQILWQIVKRANTLHARQTRLGLTASQNKRKFGAISIPKVGFTQVKDHINMLLMDLISSEKIKK